MNNFKTFFFLEIDSYLKCDNHPSLVQHQKDTLVTNPYIQGTQECTHTGVHTYRVHRSVYIQGTQECTRTGHTGVHTYRVHRSVYIQGTQECTHTGYTGVYTYRAHRSAHVQGTQECTRTGYTGVHTYRVHRSVYVQGMYTGHTFLFHWSLCLCGSKTALIMKLKDV